jgi:hypothetical protein
MHQKKSKIILVIIAALTSGLVWPGCALATPPSTPILPINLDVTGAGEAELLDTVEAASDLKVKVYKHKLRLTSKRPEAWSLVTEGLKGAGQQEMILTVLKRAEELDKDYPKLPIKLFASIGRLAKENKIVTAGGYTEFKNQGFLAPQFKGLIYISVTNLQGAPLPDDCIAIVPVTEEEMAVYQTAGPSRVMARLGRDAHFFPCPTWCDRDRASAFSQAEITEMKEDPVFRSAKAQTFSLTAIQDKDQLSLRLTDKTADLLLDLLKQLPADSALRLALGIDPRADALLVWESKDNNNHSMIAPEGSAYHKIGITFIAVLPGLAKNEILTGADGCALMMTTADFARFKAALDHKDPFDLPLAENSALKNFSIFWSKE